MLLYRRPKRPCQLQGRLISLHWRRKQVKKNLQSTPLYDDGEMA
jgi:hypothetical protein